MPDDPDATEVDAGALAAEARAFIGLLARLHGFSTLPRLDDHGEPAPLPEIGESVEAVSAATHLPGPQRLEVLARAVRAREQHQGLADVDLRGLAESLIEAEESTPRSSTSARLLERLTKSVEGRDPLSRSLAELAEPDDLVRNLRSDVWSTMLSAMPACGASTTTAGGVPALNIVTDAITLRPLGEFKDVVDPLEWPNCWLQSAFFKGMDLVGGAPARATGTPDDGWTAPVVETVDFGLGILSGQEVRTELDFVVFFNDPARGALGPAMGCTYDLARSIDGKILVDQGYLLVEDLHDATHAYRRYRTQKEVRFRTGTPAPEDVCPFWSLAAGLIQQGC